MSVLNEFFGELPSIVSLFLLDDLFPGLFGRPLSEVCHKNKLASPIMEAMVAVYQRGIEVNGIFRLAGSLVQKKQLKQRMNQGEDINFSETFEQVIAATIKVSG